MQETDASAAILSSLPFWVQVVANFGMFAVAVIAAAFGFTRRLAGAGRSIFEHEEAKANFTTIGDGIRSLKDAMHRLADAAEAILTILQTRERDEEIRREIDRRLRDR